MNTILKNQSLLPFNTFGIESKAKYFTSFESIEDLKEIRETDTFKKEQKLILGGGSNVLFTKDQNAFVLLNNIKGIDVVGEDEESFSIAVGGGENWHEFVLFCIKNNYAGVENMSLIPGSVGASPMQNIGAYGTEIKDVFESLEAFHLKTGETHKFDKKDCSFGYRESVFKNKYKGDYIITKVVYRLLKKPEINSSYGAINQYLEKGNISNPSIKNISDAVIAIRQLKLPDPKKIGNSGSFFKNPIVQNSLLEKIKREYPNLSTYPVDENTSKVAAGWLIEQAGWKGKTIDNKYGVHKNQALVLVNYGGATGSQIYDLSTQIIDSVKDKYGIELEREVNIL
jgi:UDP-N-acetylmuramate dehydrogenase